MRTFFGLTTIFIGIASIFLFQHRLLDLANTAIELVLRQTNTAATSPVSQQQPAQASLHPNIPQGPQEHLIVTEMSVSRAIKKVFLAIEQAEGAGARVRRSIGTPNLRNFSPFLMLDHFSIKPGAGFPDHANVGLQLWVDLPADLKACEPRYRDLRAAEIPKVEVDEGKATIKVISGQSHGIDSVKDLAYTPVWIIDIELRPGAKVTQPLPQNWSAFSYVLEGDVYFGEGDDRRKVEQYNLTVFGSEGDVVHVEADANATKPSRLVIIAGTPLDQPVVQYGPFVLTSKDQVYQALSDYQSHANGFERAKDWRSEIGKSMMH
uniref:Pirin C-terminal domain-containing protein n=1 Tax=Bionectria ochroleuca TaxID=29856 RepID=A0A0B7K3E5_BIOOC